MVPKRHPEAVHSVRVGADRIGAHGQHSEFQRAGDRRTVLVPGGKADIACLEVAIGNKILRRRRTRQQGGNESRKQWSHRHLCPSRDKATSRSLRSWFIDPDQACLEAPQQRSHRLVGRTSGTIHAPLLAKGLAYSAAAAESDGSLPPRGRTQGQGEWGGTDHPGAGGISAPAPVFCPPAAFLDRIAAAPLHFR
jgi:hypothetical protein